MKRQTVLPGMIVSLQTEYVKVFIHIRIDICIVTDIIGRMKHTETSGPAPQAPNRPTLRTVANASGLAVTTVSRALNNASDIALSTRKRVQKVADELGYIPNRAGRGLRTGRTHMLSVVLPPRAQITGFTASIIAGLGEVCRDAGFELSATPDAPHQDALAVIKSVVQNHRADGIVLSHTKPQDLRVKYLIENNFPFVTHGRTELASPHASVDFDNELFAELAVNRLAARGRKHLLLVGDSTCLTYQTHLLNGFHRAVTRKGLHYLEPTEVASLETPLNKLRDIIARLCASCDSPDGIVCVGDTASLAIMAGIYDAGKTPGLDVEIIAKQTTEMLDYVTPAIDSYFEDITLTGRRLGETLLQVIEGRLPLDQLRILIPPEPRLRLQQPLTST